jgi:8-oxo-dGTP pyrophosphatase MutT (NUDIX family)
MEEQELAAAEAAGSMRVPPTPRPAAGVILVRDGGDGPEVLLVRRRSDMGFAADAYVFPGGTLDDDDGDPAWRELLVEPPAAALAGATDRDSPSALTFVVAALREMFEETGALLTAGPEPDRSALAGGRAALVAGERRFLDIVRERGLELAADRLILCARWITPESLSRRYDARFFLAAAPDGVEIEAERGELVEHLWIEPGRALERYFAYELRMLYPTARTLEWLAEGDSVRDLQTRFMDREVRPILPRLRRVEGRVVPVIPGEPGYDERDGDG